MDTLEQLLNLRLFRDTDFEFSVINFISAAIVILVAYGLVWLLTTKLLPRVYKRQKTEIGSQYTINQLLKYFIYTIGLLWAIQSLGINTNVIWGAIAALAVGFGLGLQQTFNDLFSGLIILFEGKIRVGDSVEVNNIVGRIIRIGIRTSDIETRSNVVRVVPNSKLVVESVNNWNHDYNRVRFMLTVGVHYDSDPEQVRDLLLDIAQAHSRVMKQPAPFVRFADFGDSALVFELYFYSRYLIVSGDTLSDLRYEIFRVFKENNIEIPYPQRVVYSGNS